MPVYPYECVTCGVLEVEHAIKEPARTECSQCGAPCKRLIGGGGRFTLKGRFWSNTGHGLGVHHAPTFKPPKPGEA